MTRSILPRASSRPARSPSDSSAADIAPTRSSSMPAGKADAIIKPSVEISAEASTSAEELFRSFKILEHIGTHIKNLFSKQI